MPTDPNRQRLLRLTRQDPALVERLLMVADTDRAPRQLTSPDAAAAILRPYLAGLDHERVVVAALDRRLRVVDVDVLFRGSDAYTVFCPRTILRWALTRDRSVSAILVGHNHPSGEATPSQEDDDVTRRLLSACRAVGLKCVDHLIHVDHGKPYSYAAESGFRFD